MLFRSKTPITTRSRAPQRSPNLLSQERLSFLSNVISVMLFSVEMNPYYRLILRAQLEVEMASGFVDRIAVRIKLVRNVDGLSAYHVTLLRTEVISGRKVKRCITGNAGRLISRCRIRLRCRLASEIRKIGRASCRERV